MGGVGDDFGGAFPCGGGDFFAGGVGEPDGDMEGVGDALFDQSPAQVGVVKEEEDIGLFDMLADVLHESGVQATFLEFLCGDEGGESGVGNRGFDLGGEGVEGRVRAWGFDGDEDFHRVKKNRLRK